MSVQNTVFLMENQIMHYSWGSRDFIARLCREKVPSELPEAELWLGAHSKAPSLIIEGQNEMPLDQYITHDPRNILGNETATEYGELPFLFKVLSAAQPLSVQVHPNKEQARAGFKAEEANLLPLDAAIRNYKDKNHKPEMLLALTPFEALVGIRPYAEIVELVTLLRLDDRIEEFEDIISGITEEKLRGFFAWIMGLKKRTRDKVRNNILRAAMLRRGCDHPSALAIEWICRLNNYYPEDIGIFAPLVMNTIKLQPGEAIYMDAGILHAYLQGSGLEIMANSDNVLRCALTVKHIDVPELMKIASFKPVYPHYIRPEMQGMEEVYVTPAPEFQLSRFNLSSSIRFNQLDSAQIILVMEGSLKITPEVGDALELEQGQSAFISKTAISCQLAGKATFYRVQAGGK
ncbi:MAG: mannose-6-phosphate isomerase, class I [Candidatus Stygibacter frigidus]|nr:mannose-6-phosphate isomerase, class I [Candidatus Stygibacter frigidus]